MAKSRSCDEREDWVVNRWSFVFAWGVPVIAMGAAGYHDPSIRTFVWVMALLWMGGACMMNARHCARTHCRFTGPFFLLMTVPVILLGLGVLSLGSYGWWWLAGGILIGTVILWWGSEALWGKYLSKKERE